MSIVLKIYIIQMNELFSIFHQSSCCCSLFVAKFNLKSFGCSVLALLYLVGQHTQSFHFVSICLYALLNLNKVFFYSSSASFRVLNVSFYFLACSAFDSQSIASSKPSPFVADVLNI